MTRIASTTNPVDDPETHPEDPDNPWANDPVEDPGSMDDPDDESNDNPDDPTDTNSVAELTFDQQVQLRCALQQVRQSLYRRDKVGADAGIDRALSVFEGTTADQLPRGSAIAIAERGAKDDLAKWDVQKAAFYAVHQHLSASYADKAERFARAAESAGQNAQPIRDFVLFNADSSGRGTRFGSCDSRRQRRS